MGRAAGVADRVRHGLGSNVTAPAVQASLAATPAPAGGWRVRNISRSTLAITADARSNGFTPNVTFAISSVGGALTDAFGLPLRVA